MSWPCQNQSLVGLNGRKARVTALRCRRWSCPLCAKRLRAQMVARALAGFACGEPVRMLTLTSPGDEDYERSYEQLRPRWKRLRESIRRRFPGLRLEYFDVIERQQRGHAHLHVLFRGGYLPQRWVSAAAAKAGFGRIVDVRSVGKAAGRYVAKYLGKEMGNTPAALGFPALPRWHRRAAWSRGWAPAFAKSKQQFRASLSGFAWWIFNCRPVLAAERVQRAGFDVEEIDYGDLAPRDQAWELRRKLPVQVIAAGALPCRCEMCRDLTRRPRHSVDWRSVPVAPPVRHELWPTQ
jgi:hypothetical protein